MSIITVYNQSTRYLYSSTFKSTCTCTHILLKIQYLYLYLYSSFFQVLVFVLEYFCPVLAPSQLFHNMPEKDIARLQRIQNCLARVVTKAPRFSRSVLILKRLHWLPVKFRIHFKIGTILSEP